MRVWWRFCEDEEFATSLWVPTRKRPREKHMLEFEESHCRLDFASQSQLRPNKSDLRNSLPRWFWVCLFTYLYQYYITLITHEIVIRSFSKELLREKTLAKYMKDRDCFLTIIYTISLKFHVLLLLHLYILERFLVHAHTSHILSVERSFGAHGKHWKKPLSGGCNL